MGRIRLLPLLLCVNLMLVCCSCGWLGDQEYVCDIDAVDSIQIIRLGEYSQEKSEYDYTVISVISDLATFADRLNNVKHSVNWSDPGVLMPESVVIRIEYLNGDYDLLHPNAQIFNRDDENNYGYFFFDKEQFDSLISDYSTYPNEEA